MKPSKAMTDAELKYAASDLRTAIAVADPSSSNMDRYLANYRAMITEQETRANKRTLRRMMADAPADLLAAIQADRPEAIRPRGWFQRPRYLFTAQRINTGQAYRAARARSAMFSLYWRQQ